jgi:putative FmdB family regulatory protein
MPMLKFKCVKCKRVFEELVMKIGETDAVCPDCGSRAERAYEGRCYFGTPGSSHGGECSHNCSTCGGCGK